MGKLLHVLLTGTLGAGLVHICTLFLIPIVAQNDAWARLSTLAQTGSFSVIEPNAGIASSMRALDRNFVVGGCQFSLREGPVLIRGLKAPDFWSLSVFNRRGENIFSVNDRISTDGTLDVIVATPVQIIELQNDMPDELKRSVFAEAPIDEGFVVLRAFKGEESLAAQARSFIDNSVCENF